VAFAVFPHIHLNLYSDSIILFLYFYFRKVQQPKKQTQQNPTAIIEICASHRFQLRRQLHIFIYADIFEYIFKLPLQSATKSKKKRGNIWRLYLIPQI